MSDDLYTGDMMPMPENRGRKCIVDGCLNHERDGGGHYVVDSHDESETERWVCAPCFAVLTNPRHVHSVAWRNFTNVVRDPWGLLPVLCDLVERCDGEEGVRADGSNIDTQAAHAVIERVTLEGGLKDDEQED